MVEKGNSFQDYVDFQEDLESKYSEKGSFFRRVKRVINDVFYLLKNSSANAGKIKNYDNLFEENQKYRQDVIDLGERLGEMGEKKEIIFGELCKLAEDYETRGERMESLFDRVCGLSDKCKVLEEVADERGGIIKQQRSAMHEGRRYIFGIEKKLRKKEQEISDARSRMKKIFKPKKKEDKLQQRRDSNMNLYFIKHFGIGVNEMEEIRAEEGIKGLRKKYVELLNERRAGRKEQGSKFIKFSKLDK